MKQLLLLLVCCLTINITFAQAARPAADIMTEAFSKAKKEKKNVFVKYSASWCGWCKRMDAAMEDPACKKFFDDNYVTVHLVTGESGDKKHLENNGAESLIIKYNGKPNAGLPFWYILNAKAELIADCYMPQDKSIGQEYRNIIGCPAGENEVAAFIEILKKTAKISEKQIEAIRKRFRENETVSH